jgi:hypothetical protein
MNRKCPAWHCNNKYKVNKYKVMFVFWNSLSGKLFFKLFCVSLLLEKLINEKHFPVKGKFGLVSRKVFS